MQHAIETPGIASHIAKYLDSTDIKTLYVLFNNERIRYELYPFCKTMIKDFSMKQEKIKIENRLNKNIYDQLNTILEAADHNAKIKYTIQLFEYICTEKEYIHILGKSFGRIVERRLYELIDILDEHNQEEEDYLFMMKIERELWDYFNWCHTLIF